MKQIDPKDVPFENDLRELPKTKEEYDEIAREFEGMSPEDIRTLCKKWAEEE